MGAARGRRVLVTGATGMVGSALVARLVAEGHEVAVLMRPQAQMVRLQPVAQHLRVFTGDIHHGVAVRAAIEEAHPEIVYHLASTAFNPPTISSQAHLDTIVGGTLNLLEALKDRPGVRCIMTGSAAVYGSGSALREDAPLRPGTVLGAAKASASLLLQTYARLFPLETVELRLFMPYGPGEHPRRLIPQTILSALAGEDIPMTQGHQQRDLVFIDDVVEALCAAATCHLSPGVVFNIGSGVGRAVREVVQQILQLMGNPVRALVGAVPTRPDEIMEMSADITAARAVLGWQPRVGLEEGLQRSIAWFTEQRQIVEQLRQRTPTPVGQVPASA